MVVALIVVLGSVGLWGGLPLLWLYLGSQVQVATGSLGAALGAAMLGFLVSVVASMLALGWLSRRHGELRRARGLDAQGNVLVEGVVVASAFVAVIGFAIWFFLFAGTSPVPLAPGG